jgi:hypothetical protein
MFEPPGEILETGEMAAVCVLGRVKFLTHLKFAIDSRVEKPLVLTSLEILEVFALL